MSILSDLLDFRHFDCSKGSTVERPFLEALLAALGEDGLVLPNKDAVLGRAIEIATHDAVPPGTYSAGETVTDKALQLIIDGVRAHGLAKVSLTSGAAAARVAVAEHEKQSSEAADDDDEFDPSDLSDERLSALRSVKVRIGQGPFRARVLRAYGNGCAITGCDVTEVLDAAHIRPYRGPRTNSIRNGICLRTDLHRLWDTGRLAVHETTHVVLLSTAMVGTSYEDLAGATIRLPSKDTHHPMPEALLAQREWAGL